MTYKVRCPQCGNEYQRPGRHWIAGSCDFPSLTREQKEILAGVLLGGANVTGARDRERSSTFPSVRIESVSEEFIRWVVGKLEPVVTGVRPRENEGRHDTWRGFTVSHPELQQAKMWVGLDRAASLPWDLEWTPTILKLLYATSGQLNWNDGGSNVVIQSQRALHLFIRFCEEQGWEYTLYDYEYDDQTQSRVFLKRGSKQAFFEYVGDPVPGMEHLWQHEDEAAYRRLNPVLDSE